MLKKHLIIVLAMSLLGTASFAQNRYFTKTGRIQFFSKAPLENIEASNRTVTAVVDIKTGAIQFSVPMKGFEFEKQLMQQHFNENYVESDKFPKGEFKGTITNNSDINYTKDGSYTAKVKGKMTIHGVTKDVETTGTIKVSGGSINATSGFNIQLSDYNVDIPSVVKDKVSNNIRITVNCTLEPLK